MTALLTKAEIQAIVAIWHEWYGKVERNELNFDNKNQWDGIYEDDQYLDHYKFVDNVELCVTIDRDENETYLSERIYVYDDKDDLIDDFFIGELEEML